jgi:hypothetical protein
VYRLAETKAAQIGQVSRVLKENAVDCLLNVDQTKFSQEVIRRHNGQNVTVRQVLSDGTRLPHYAVGDRPFSFVCDYQARCEYRCLSDSKSDSTGKSDSKSVLKINDDSYSQAFVAMNADRIRQRIRDLFRVQHFYARRLLMKHLAGHPREQIDVALTQLLHDAGERLIDKYGRPGRLINVGEYYLFQPTEITDPRIDAHDRSAPLQFKRDHVAFPLNDGTLERLAVKHGLKPLALPATAEGHPPQAQAQAQIEAIHAEFDAIVKGPRAPVDKNTKAWAELCADIMGELHERFQVPTDAVKKCVAHHFLDELAVSAVDAQLQFLNAVYNEGSQSHEFDRLARDYFDGRVLKNPKYKGEEGMLLLNSASKNGLQLVVRRNAESAWTVAKSSEEWSPYKEQIAGMVPKPAALAPIIGFVSEFK